MAATPPHQINFTPDTPTTPRHGPLYDDELPPMRSSARLRQKRALDLTAASKHDTQHATSFARTPGSPRQVFRQTSLTSRSPGATPKRKPVQRVQVPSPTSPDAEPAQNQNSGFDQNHLQVYNSATAMMGDGMLPTPVKTPRKKPAAKSTVAGRALFHDETSISEIAQSPRKAKRNRRFNGYSLESFRENENDGDGSIQIFTDSRDQVPETNKEEDNPFLRTSRRTTRSERIPGTVKRRKVNQDRPLDPQVEEALRNDDGMVYVFRGKKVFRRFDDNGEEEEEIDPEDLGLLEHSLSDPDTRRRFKTLTRKSIKPTRLFQTEAQRRSREAEKEEEAATDIEDAETNLRNDLATIQDVVETAAKNTSKSAPKKSSPFDNWPRSKSTATSTTPRGPRGQKRGIAEDTDLNDHNVISL